jgi:bacillopeptidase F (M6 metalloprotease family)
MLKFKDSKKKFSIVFNAEDCSDNQVYDYELSDKEANLIMDNSDTFIFSSAEDIDEWNEQFMVEDIAEWNNFKEDWSLEKYFDFVAE